MVRADRAVVQQRAVQIPDSQLRVSPARSASSRASCHVQHNAKPAVAWHPPAPSALAMAEPAAA
eukprot:364308-Chlamydomonas_euryale.AAC.7